jgi:hypothetical protein
MFIFQAAAGAVQTVFTLQYLPELLYWNSAVPFTNMRIDVEGDGTILQLDAAGLDAIAALNMPGRVAAGYFIQLADGIVKNKVVTITILNVAANPAINIWGRSKHNQGLVYVISKTEACIANAGREFAKFAYLAMPAAVTVTDIITVEYSDGLTQRLDAIEIQADNALYQNDVPATVQGINNSAKRINKVSFQPAVAQNVYIVKLAPVGNVPATA